MGGCLRPLQRLTALTSLTVSSIMVLCVADDADLHIYISGSPTTTTWRRTGRFGEHLPCCTLLYEAVQDLVFDWAVDGSGEDQDVRSLCAQMGERCKLDGRARGGEPDMQQDITDELRGVHALS